MKQCLQDIFIFKNLMIHIVCRHYVHMTHVKFFQETNQMITRLYIFMCSSFRLQNITLFQGLSCLWQHNSARMIISLTWFHNYFHGICATLGATGSNRLFWSITQQILLEKISFFSSSFTEILHALGIIIWINNSCCSLGITIQAGKHQHLKFIIFIASFSRIHKSKWRNMFPIREKNLTFYASHP